MLRAFRRTTAAALIIIMLNGIVIDSAFGDFTEEIPTTTHSNQSGDAHVAAAARKAGTHSVPSSGGSDGEPYDEPCVVDLVTREKECWIAEPGSERAVRARDAAVKATAGLHLPIPTIHFGPDPHANEWDMIPVGYPLWLWTDGRTSLTSSASASGLSVSLTAAPGPTTFTMGDGHQRICTVQLPRQRSTSATPPTGPCSYVYQLASPQGHPYTVTATTTWTVAWSAAGYSGTFDMTRNASATITIGELQAIIER
jgi:hypothetical protein